MPACPLHAVLTDGALYSWGWRIPFIISILGAAVGVYIRRHLKDPENDETDADGRDPHHAGGHHGSHGHHAAHGPLRRVLPGIATVVLIDFLTALGFYTTVIFLPLYFQVSWY